MAETIHIRFLAGSSHNTDFKQQYKYIYQADGKPDCVDKEAAIEPAGHGRSTASEMLVEFHPGRIRKRDTGARHFRHGGGNRNGPMSDRGLELKPLAQRH